MRAGRCTFGGLLNMAAAESLGLEGFGAGVRVSEFSGGKKLWLFLLWDLQNLQRSHQNLQYTSTMILREGRSRFPDSEAKFRG